MNGPNSSLKRLQGLYLAAAVLRLVLFFAFPGLPELVAGRVEVSTPVTSFKRCMAPLFRQVHLHSSGRADHRDSTRGPFPLQPQCFALRWWRLPPSAPAAARSIPPAELRLLARLYVSVIYSGRPPKRQFSNSHRQFWGGRLDPAVYLSEEGQEMEWLCGRCTVRLHHLGAFLGLAES